MFDFIKKRTIIMVLTLIFAVTALYFLKMDKDQETTYSRIQNNCMFIMEADGVKREVKVWYEGSEKKYYLFVPSYMDLDGIRLKLSNKVKMYLDGKELKTGSNLSDYEYGKDYQLHFSNVEKSRTLQLVQTGTMATMYLDTQSGTMDLLREDKENVEKGNVTFYTEDGKLDYVGKVNKIKGHGNTSWDFSDKKPLNVNLAEEGDILGMGAAKKWILINNFNEVSNLSNKLIYDLAKDVGLDYSPDSQLVDLYMNGRYYGVYLLSERNEIAKHRVDVETPTNKKGSSYLVDQDILIRAQEKGDHYVRTKGEYTLGMVSPKESSQELEEEVLSDFQSLENALYSEDGIDPDTGKSWDEIIDLDSWVKKYLIEEIFENVDAGKLSQYFYKTGFEGDDKLYSGPVWDYNSAFGNPHSGNDIHNPRCLRACREWIEYNKFHNRYYFLYNQEKFYNRMVELYAEVFEPLLLEMANEKMAQWQEKIRLSSEANFLRWKKGDSNYESVDAQVEAMHQFLVERIEFLHDDWVEGTEYCYITTLSTELGNYKNYSIRYGEVLKESDLTPAKNSDESKTFAGWYDRDTDQPYDFTQPVTKTRLNLYAKWE